MEHVGAKLGVKVLLTPKCHAEIAGEGVEYIWAFNKGAYCNLALKEKNILLQVLDIVCWHTSFQSSGFESLEQGMVLSTTIPCCCLPCHRQQSSLH